MTRQSHARDALQGLTSELCERPRDWTDGYRIFMQTLGETAYAYDTYINAAVTSAGYRRDTSLSRSEVVAGNTDTALLIADELAAQDLIDLERTIDAVALGYIPTWTQSSYLQFFFAVMARPELAYIDDIGDEMRASDLYDLEIFNDQSLPNDERLPHYDGLVNHFWNTIKQVPCRPISVMVESFDRTMTLGGRAEESLALQMGIRILQPILLSESIDYARADISPELKAHYTRLSALGADLFAAPVSTHMSLKPVIDHSSI